MFKHLFLALSFTLTLGSCDTLSSLASSAGGLGVGELSVAQIAQALKDALSQGINKGLGSLSGVDGYFKNAALKILLPKEAQGVEQKLRQIGLGNLVDDAILKINRSAEDAAKTAAPIFMDALRTMSFQDAMGILMGADNSATQYFKGATTSRLYTAFKPVITNSLNKLGALTAWNKVITEYNKIPLLQDINPNLDDHVTNKAIEGVFVKVGEEERAIRNNPALRSTDLMRRAFAKQD